MQLLFKSQAFDSDQSGFGISAYLDSRSYDLSEHYINSLQQTLTVYSWTSLINYEQSWLRIII